MFDRLIDDRIRELIGDTVFYAPSAKVVADAQLISDLEQMIEWGELLLTCAAQGDYSNGNEFQGSDEGRYLANRFLDEQYVVLQSLKDKLKELKKEGEMLVHCSSCGKELDCNKPDECFSDEPLAFTHPTSGGILCKECYSNSNVLKEEK